MDIVKYLLEMNVSSRHQNVMGHTAYDISLKMNHAEVIRVLESLI